MPKSNTVHPLWITPTWPAPARVKGLTTLRAGGFSQGPFESFNLAAHVGDLPETVLQNRVLLREKAKLPQEPSWLTQVHGTEVLELDKLNTLTQNHDASNQQNEADAAMSRTPGIVAAVLTADCLPILICDQAGTEVAAIHAGWRGLAKGVIEATVAKLTSKRETLLVWLGPAIGPLAFVVGEQTRMAFTKPGDEEAFVISSQHPNTQSTSQFISPSIPQFIAPSIPPFNSQLPDQSNQSNLTWTADLYHLARLRLQSLNINPANIYGGDFCTYTETERFYSFRRSNPTGRMATLIWLE